MRFNARWPRIVNGKSVNTNLLHFYVRVEWLEKMCVATTAAYFQSIVKLADRFENLVRFLFSRKKLNDS